MKLLIIEIDPEKHPDNDAEWKYKPSSLSRYQMFCGFGRPKGGWCDRVTGFNELQPAIDLLAGHRWGHIVDMHTGLIVKEL